MLLEKKCSNAQDKTPDWADGEFKQPSVPGSEIAVVHWSSYSDGNNVRVYFQDGMDVANVCEWALKKDGWALTIKSINFS